MNEWPSGWFRDEKPKPAGGDGGPGAAPPGRAGEPTVHEQRLPGGQPAHGQRCRLNVAQSRRLRRKHPRWDKGVLGGHAVAIERRQRINLITAVDEDARKLVRRNRRQSIDWPLQLATRNRRRMYAHQNLARTRRRRLDLLNVQAVSVQAYRYHWRSASTPVGLRFS